MSKSGPSLAKYSSLLTFIISLLIIATVLMVRVRLLGTPLERDEGEYAYMGQLLLKGIPPYVHAYTMKLPGVPLVYAFFMSIFGKTPTGIHIGLMLVNTACIALVYLLGKRFFPRETAVTAAAFYALLSLSQSVLGVFAHATHLVVLFTLSGILLLAHGSTRQHPATIFTSGICFGMAFLMKQHAAVMIIFAMLFQLLPQGGKNKKLILWDCFTFLTGAAVPYLVCVFWLYNAGVFDRFWFWTVQYAREYASGLSVSEGIEQFSQQFSSVARRNLPLWLLAGAGGAVVCRGTMPRSEKMALMGYLTASFVMVCPGFYFRPHYFVLLLPPVALLAAYAATSAMQKPATILPKQIRALAAFFLIAITSAYPFAVEKDYLFTLSPQEVSRKIYGTNPFQEAIQIASRIRESTTSEDRIAILGSEPEILFYADRLSATGHIYMYGLMEDHRYASQMQQQLITEIETTSPAYVVVVHNSASWLLRPNSLNRVLDWGDSFIPLRYDEVGIVEIFDDKPTRYLWGEETAGYEPAAESFVSIFRRRF